MAASLKRQKATLNVETVEGVIAKNGIVEATMNVYFHNQAAPDGIICLRLSQDHARELAGNIQGALLVARTQNQRHP
jgi:hypothetical protein